MKILRIFITLLLLASAIVPVQALPYGNTWGSYPYYPTTYLTPAYTSSSAYGIVTPNPWQHPVSNPWWFEQYAAYTHRAYADPFQTSHAIAYVGRGNPRYYEYHSPQ